MCPRCYVKFMPCHYEGADIHKCKNCHGVLVNSVDVEKILRKKEARFSADIIYMAGIILDEKEQINNISRSEMISEYQLTCPKCRKYHDRRARRFYSDDFRVELDECAQCKLIWFDENELEILQCLFEQCS